MAKADRHTRSSKTSPLISLSVQQLAHQERMIPNAPIFATYEITINAPVERIWQVATDVEKWPQWHEQLKNATIHGPFAEGTRFSFGGLFKHRLTLSTVKKFQVVMYYGTLFGYTGITKWTFAPLTGQSTKVAFTESSTGFLIGVFYRNHALKTHLKTWLEKLKQRVEQPLV